MGGQTAVQSDICLTGKKKACIAPPPPPYSRHDVGGGAFSGQGCNVLGIVVVFYVAVPQCPCACVRD